MAPDIADYFGYSPGDAGVPVTEQIALGYAAVYACIRVVAESVATLPIGVYRHLERGKQPERKHAAWSLLNRAPNPEMGAFTFRETLTAHCAGWGNGYAEIERTGAGLPVALWPLRPDLTTPIRQNGKLVYECRSRIGPARYLDPSDVLHVCGLGFDGLVGYNPIRLHKPSIGHGLAQEKYSSRFFANGSQPGGIIEYPGAVDQIALQKFRANWENMHSGPDAAHRVGILDGGAKFNATTIDPESSQLLESRKFSVIEACRIFRVPPHMIADLERATFGNIEQQSIDFVTYSLMAWLVRWEQEINRKLFLPSEADDYFAEHQTGELLRGDAKSRYEVYAMGRQWGILSVDDCREEENLNPLPDGKGREYLVPLNMHPAGEADRKLIDPNQAEGPGAGGQRPAKKQTDAVPEAP